MGNFKVKVNSEAESKEIQNILESIGFKKWDAWSELGSIGGFIWTDSDMTYCDNRIEYFDESPRKEITLQELRAMVNPSLNDQYAEIEQVRQEEIRGTVKAKSAWDTQIGGIHYKQFKIQPMQFALENKLDAAQQNVIKYIMRHSFKSGKQDLEKAKHYIDLMIEFYYGENNNG